jgi:uncharacterized iron-regulated membrane protein
MDKKRVYILSLRQYRKLHRIFGLTLAIILLVSAVTGLLLGWKKDADWIQPPSQKGVSKDLMTWKPMHEIAAIGEQALINYDSTQSDNKINRMDARPSKGIVKILFKKGNWEVQVDATSGEVKSIAKRHSDWIESLHDGSIINDTFKLISMNFLGIGVVILALTGFWLWYGPRLIRVIKRKQY